MGVVCLLVCLSLLVWAATRHGPVADCAVWSALFYLPVANVVVIYPVVADWALFTPEHNLYVPLAGLTLLVGLGFDAIARHAKPLRIRVVQGALAAVLLACAAQSALRTRDWKDEERIFAGAVAAGSESPRVHFNLGNILLAKGDTAGAAGEYESALRRAPNDAGSWGNLAVTRQRRGEYEAALDAYHRALALRPGDARLHENLGSLQVTVGDLQAARESFEWALRLDPERSLARRALAALHRDEQRRR
jgi:tetratricopeptide (TPR) repeat protein